MTVALPVILALGATTVQIGALLSAIETIA